MRYCKCDQCKIGEPWTPDQCRACWQYHNNPELRKFWDNEPTPPPDPITIQTSSLPSLGSRLGHFGTALIKHAGNGFKNVTADQERVRLEICHQCPRCVNDFCLECGCPLKGNLRNKTKWASEDCPLHKWPKIE